MLDAFARLLDAVQLLVREHLALARVELKTEARSLAHRLSPAAVGVPLLLSGWLLLMLGVAVALPLPPWAALGLVAIANLAAGGALTRSALRRMSAAGAGLPAAPADDQALADAGAAPHR